MKMNALLIVKILKIQDLNKIVQINVHTILFNKLNITVVALLKSAVETGIEMELLVFMCIYNVSLNSLFELFSFQSQYLIV